MEKSKANQIPVAHLAYLGDAVMELMIRERLVEKGVAHPQEHASEYVTAVAQSKACDRLIPLFTEEEADIYKRGRNATHTSPKSATHAQYSRATGLECVFAYLHLCENKQRLEELLRSGYEYL